MPQELLTAKFFYHGTEPQCAIDLQEGGDPRVLAMMAQALLMGLERGGFMTPKILEAKTAITEQLQLWGMVAQGQFHSDNGHSGLIPG